MKESIKQLIRLIWTIDMINAVGNLNNRPPVWQFATTDKTKSGWVTNSENNKWQYIRVYENGDIVYLITCELLKFHKYFKNPFWVQYNPNHMLPADYKELDHVMKYVDHAHYTRADFALDIFNLAMQMYGFGLFGVTKEHIGRNGQVETRYWGSSKSERQIRMYNKAVERKKHHKENEIPEGVEEWWRLEFQLRQGKFETWQDEIIEKMQSFHVLSFDANDDISEIDKAVLRAVTTDDFDFKNVSKPYATKIRKLVRENSGFDTTLAEMAVEAFKKQKDDLQRQLDTMLARYDIKAQTDEITAYFEARIAETGQVPNFTEIFDNVEETTLERKVQRQIIKNQFAKEQLSADE